MRRPRRNHSAKFKSKVALAEDWNGPSFSTFSTHRRAGADSGLLEWLKYRDKWSG